MFEMQESEMLESDFTDAQLRYILIVYGPAVKDWLLLPGPVPLAEVQHDSNHSSIIPNTLTKLG